MSESRTPRTDAAREWPIDKRPTHPERAHRYLRLCYDLESDLADAQARIAELEAERERLAKDAERHRYWRLFYSSQFVLVLPAPVSLRFDARRPMVEPAGFNYAEKVDAAIDAAIATKEKS